MWILLHLFQSNFCDYFNITDETLSEMKYVFRFSLYLQKFYLYFILNVLTFFNIWLCVYKV